MNWSWYYISILVLTTATAFLGHEALEFASERLKAEVLNVETAMRDWTAMGFAVNCWSETRFRKGIWLMTCIRWFLLKLPLEIHDCRPSEVDIGMGTWWNLQMVRDGESGSAFFMSLLIWGGDWVSVQHTVQPLFPEWEHDGRGYQNRGAFFLGFHWSSLGVASVLLAFLCLNACWIPCSHTLLDNDSLRCSPSQEQSPAKFLHFDWGDSS